MLLLHKIFLGLGALAFVSVPLAVLSFPVWESPLCRWLERRRRQRDARPPRLAVRGLR